MNPKYGSRKFIIALLLIVSAVGLGAYDKLDSGGITIILGLVGGGYGFANVLDKRSTQPE